MTSSIQNFYANINNYIAVIINYTVHIWYEGMGRIKYKQAGKHFNHVIQFIFSHLLLRYG